MNARAPLLGILLAACSGCSSGAPRTRPRATPPAIDLAEIEQATGTASPYVSRRRAAGAADDVAAPAAVREKPGADAGAGADAAAPARPRSPAVVDAQPRASRPDAAEPEHPDRSEARPHAGEIDLRRVDAGGDDGDERGI